MAFQEVHHDGHHDFKKLKLDTSGGNTLRRFTDTASLPAAFLPPFPRLNRIQTPPESSPIDINQPDKIPTHNQHQEKPVLHSGISDAININQDALRTARQSLDDSGTRRKSSISFDPNLKLDNGNTHSMGESLPKPSGIIRTNSRSIMQELVNKYNPQSPTTTDNIKDATQERKSTDSTRCGDDVSLVSPTSRLESRDQVPSLTSATTDTPRLDSLTTSPSYENGDLSLSPSTASSPCHAFPNLSDSGVLTSPRSIDGRRSKSYQPERNGSLRRFNRRSSTRSVSSIKSPASMFLSKWSRDTPAAPEPDDEGQAIGDNGEYIIGRQLGFGGFSVVKEVSTIENNEQVKRAVKIVKKQLSGKTDEENEKLQCDFEHEVFIWRHLNHPNVSPLLAVFNDPFATWCVTSLNVGGTLWDLVKNHRKAKYPTPIPGIEEADMIVEPERYTGITLHVAKRYIQQLASALKYLHNEMQIVHRDVKLENCLLNMSATSTDASGLLQLCDFGLADFINYNDRDDFENEKMLNEGEPTSPCGTSETSNSITGSLQYASPEMIKSKKPLYQTSSDMWAFGVVCYALLASDLPFSHPLMPKVQSMILEGDWNRQSLTEALEAQRESVNSVDSEAAMELVESCLSMDVSKRWSITDATARSFLHVEEVEGSTIA